MGTSVQETGREQSRGLSGGKQATEKRNQGRERWGQGADLSRTDRAKVSGRWGRHMGVLGERDFPAHLVPLEQRWRAVQEGPTQWGGVRPP